MGDGCTRTVPLTTTVSHLVGVWFCAYILVMLGVSARSHTAASRRSNDQSSNDAVIALATRYHSYHHPHSSARKGRILFWLFMLYSLIYSDALMQGDMQIPIHATCHESLCGTVLAFMRRRYHRQRVH